MFFSIEDSPVKMMERGEYQKAGSILVGVTKDEGSRFTGFIPGQTDYPSPPPNIVYR